MNLFWYTRVNEGKEYLDALNLQKVIRVVAMENGETLVLLDDLHQRLQEVPVTNKQGKVTAMKNVMNTFQSEISLNVNDSKRFYELTNGNSSK